MAAGLPNYFLPAQVEMDLPANPAPAPQPALARAAAIKRQAPRRAIARVTASSARPTA